MTDKSGTDTLEWEGDVVDNKVINLSSGDDHLRGNAGANLLAAYGGENTVRGNGGDDAIDVGDGVGGDVVRCGAGQDAVTRDLPVPETGEPGDTISADCEVQQDPPTITPAGEVSPTVQQTLP